MLMHTGRTKRFGALSTNPIVVIVVVDIIVIVIIVIVIVVIVIVVVIIIVVVVVVVIVVVDVDEDISQGVSSDEHHADVADGGHGTAVLHRPGQASSAVVSCGHHCHHWQLPGQTRRYNLHPR